MAANLPTEENSDCTPRPGATPVLILNGTADPINPYDGGRVTLFGFADRGTVRSARESAAFFARRNGLAEVPVFDDDPRPSDPGPVERTAWRAGAAAEVMLYTVHGGGHTLPQPGIRFPHILGRSEMAFDGPAEIWSFFVRHGAGS